MQELDNQILVLSNQIIVLSLCHRRTHGSIRQSNLKSISLEIKLSPSWRLSNSKSFIVIFTSVFYKFFLLKYLAKIFQIDKFGGADSNYDNSFLKFCPKFGPKFRNFLFFTKFYNLTNSGVLISNINFIKKF